MVKERSIDFGQTDETAAESIEEKSLEEKYKAEMRQIVSQKIELPISTLPEMIKEQIDLKPEFQRRERWDIPRRSRFIESIFMNVPIPPVFLGENNYGQYEVLDGRQRLTALSEFMKNGYSLKSLDVWSELNGQNFADLEKKGLERLFTRRFVPAVIVLKESSPQVKYDVFDRLNTGGVVADPMEIRNAVYPGKFNRLLHELSNSLPFRRLWGIPVNDHSRESNVYYQKMQDLELVLRFFAIPTYEGRMKLKDWLGDFLDSRNKAYDSNPTLENEDRMSFVRAVENCWSIFGVGAFLRPAEPGKKQRKSAPLADAVMYSLARVNLGHRVKEIKEGFENLCREDNDFIKAITSGTNGRGAIQTRLNKAEELVNSMV